MITVIPSSAYGRILVLVSHASASETGFGSLYVRGQVFAVLYLTDDFRCRVGRRAVVDAVDIAEDNQTCASIMEAISPESSSLSVNISSLTEMVSFSLTMGITPFSSITVMQFFWLR